MDHRQDIMGKRFLKVRFKALTRRRHLCRRSNLIKQMILWIWKGFGGGRRVQPERYVQLKIFPCFLQINIWHNSLGRHCNQYMTHEYVQVLISLYLQELLSVSKAVIGYLFSMPHISGLLQVVSQLYIEKEEYSLCKWCAFSSQTLLLELYMNTIETSLTADGWVFNFQAQPTGIGRPIWWYRSYYEVDLGHRKCLMKHCSKPCPELHLRFVEEYAFQVLWWQLARYWFSMTQFCHAESNISSQ